MPKIRFVLPSPARGIKVGDEMEVDARGAIKFCDVQKIAERVVTSPRKPVVPKKPKGDEDFLR